MITGGETFTVDALARFAVTNAAVVVAVTRLGPTNQIENVLRVEVIVDDNLPLSLHLLTLPSPS